MRAIDSVQWLTVSQLREPQDEPSTGRLFYVDGLSAENSILGGTSDIA